MRAALTASIWSTNERSRNVLVWIGAVCFGLLALLNLAIGTYHSVLFGTQGAHSMFSLAYRIPVSAAEMTDRARALGAGAIETYSLLLAGYGLLSLLWTASMLRGRWGGFWMNAVFVGISQLAVTYGLIIPGHLGGANAYLGPMLYLLGVATSAVGLGWSTARGTSRPGPSRT